MSVPRCKRCSVALPCPCDPRKGAPEPQREPVTEEQLDAIDRMGSPLLRALVAEVRASRDAYARGYAEAQLRLEESVLTRVATEARRKALEGDDCGTEHDEAVRACKRAIRALIAKEGADG